MYPGLGFEKVALDTHAPGCALDIHTRKYTSRDEIEEARTLARPPVHTPTPTPTSTPTRYHLLASCQAVLGRVGALLQDAKHAGIREID